MSNTDIASRCAWTRARRWSVPFKRVAHSLCLEGKPVPTPIENSIIRCRVYSVSPQHHPTSNDHAQKGTLQLEKKKDESRGAVRPTATNYTHPSYKHDFREVDTKVPRSCIRHATRPALSSVIFAALGTSFCCGHSYLRFQRSFSWLAWAYHPPPWPPLLPPRTWTRIPDEAAVMVEDVRSSAPAFNVGRDTCRR